MCTHTEREREGGTCSYTWAYTDRGETCSHIHRHNCGSLSFITEYKSYWNTLNTSKYITSAFFCSKFLNSVHVTFFISRVTFSSILGVAAHAFNLYTGEAETDICDSTEWVPGLPWLHGETLSSKQMKQNKMPFITTLCGRQLLNNLSFRHYFKINIHPSKSSF